MSFIDQLRWSLRHLKRQLLESMLVVMAIALGVGVVITVLGMLLSVGEQFSDLESAVHFRTFEIVDKTEAAMRQNAPLTLLGNDPHNTKWSTTMDQIAELQGNLPSNLYAYVQMGWVARTPLLPIEEVDDESKLFWLDSNQIYITGTLPQYFSFLDVQLQNGNFFLSEDVQNKSKVLVVTADLAEELFGDTDPIGQVIPLTLPDTEDVISYTVLGVLAPTEKNQGYSGFRDGRTAYAPVTASPFFGQDETSFSHLSVGIEPGLDIFSTLERVQNEAELIWGKQVVVRSSLFEFRESQKQMQRYALLIGVLASVGLVIAVINILNLMLARVLKRIKSIGLSMALGSARNLVFRQFMFEAFSLGLLGSVFGILLSFVLGDILKRVLGGFSAGMLGTRIILAIILGFGISLLFGIYPAYLGSRTNPVDALRAD